MVERSCSLACLLQLVTPTAIPMVRVAQTVSVLDLDAPESVDVKALRQTCTRCGASLLVIDYPKHSCSAIESSGPNAFVPA